MSGHDAVGASRVVEFAVRLSKSFGLLVLAEAEGTGQAATCRDCVLRGKDGWSPRLIELIIAVAQAACDGAGRNPAQPDSTECKWAVQVRGARP